MKIKKLGKHIGKPVEKSGVLSRKLIKSGRSILLVDVI